MKIDINLGFTNKDKKIENGILIIKKTYTGLNHRLNYLETQNFEFVPHLIEDNKDFIKGELIEGKMLEKPNKNDLKNLAIQIRKIHKSNIKLPKNNLRKRINKYLKTIHEKFLKIPEIELHGKKMNKLITNMNNINPCHNDIGGTNILKDKKDKIGLVDGEYATMGDKHFDLAYYIESQKLNKDEEKIFLNSYNSLDDYNAYIEEFMDIYKMFVNGLTLVGAYAQDVLPFPLEYIKKRVNDLSKKINKKLLS